MTDIDVRRMHKGILKKRHMIVIDPADFSLPQVRLGQLLALAKILTTRLDATAGPGEAASAQRLAAAYEQISATKAAHAAAAAGRRPPPKLRRDLVHIASAAISLLRRHKRARVPGVATAAARLLEVFQGQRRPALTENDELISQLASVQARLGRDRELARAAARLLTPELLESLWAARDALEQFPTKRPPAPSMTLRMATSLISVRITEYALNVLATTDISRSSTGQRALSILEPLTRLRAQAKRRRQRRRSAKATKKTTTAPPPPTAEPGATDAAPPPRSGDARAKGRRASKPGTRKRAKTKARRTRA